MWMSAVALAAPAPRNVVVLVNADVPEALAVAEHYAEARPGARICAVPVDPTVVDVPFADFEAGIRAPLEACIAGDPEISALVTVRGLPSRVVLPVGVASLEAVLQVGRATDAGGQEVAGFGQALYNGYLPMASVLNPAFVDGNALAGDFAFGNPSDVWYQATAGLIRAEELPAAFSREDAGEAGGIDYAGHLFLVGRLDGFDYDDAHALIDRALAAEQAPPTAPMLCMFGADEARGARDPECELATRRLAEAGVPTEWVPAFDPALSGHTVMAWMSGAADAIGAIDGNTYAPGAIVDNLTSYGAVPNNFVCSEDGAVCPAAESQTSIARWVRAGATLVHGTVEEPLNNSFPNASLLVYYAAGYSAGESWLFAQRYLHWQNLWLGDPLTTPYSPRPVVSLPDEVPAGGELVAQASHPDGIFRIRLWVDGVEVASAFADEVAWPMPDAGSHAVYAEALSGNRIWSHPDWPVPETVVRTRTPGWATADVVVAEPNVDTGGPAPAAAEDGAGCGCGHGGSSGGAVALVAFALSRTTRKRAPGSSEKWS